MRLWRALARRCVGPYGEHAAAPLTLAGWVAWSTGDELEAREALAMALGADPDYLFARLLHQACNEGLDPESIRRCLREGREGGQGTGDTTADDDGRGGAAVEGDREAEPEPEPARPLSAAPPRRRRRERSLASPSGVRRRTRSGVTGPGPRPCLRAPCLPAPPPGPATPASRARDGPAPTLRRRRSPAGRTPARRSRARRSRARESAGATGTGSAPEADGRAPDVPGAAGRGGAGREEVDQRRSGCRRECLSSGRRL